MKKSELVDAASKIVSIIPKKNIKPILSGIKIFEKDGEVYFNATDMESSIKIKVETLELEGTGAFVLDAKTLDDISKNLLNDEVTFNLESNKAIAHTGAGEIKIPVMNSDDYPELDFEEIGEDITVPREIVLRMMENVIFCASNDEMARNLNGILWEFSGKYLRLVSADSYRMAVTEEMIYDGDSTVLTFFLSLKSMKEVQALLKESSEDEFKIKFDGKRVITKIKNITFVARLMDVNFPNYKAVIPNSFQTKVVINRIELLKALKLIKIIAKSQGDTVKLDISDEQMVLSARSQDRGDGEIPFNIKKEGQNMLVAFDPSYFIEGLQHFQSEEVELNFVDEDNALQINDQDLAGFLHIIMPVKIRK
jgi:DNA polymerase-3 subunit beta